MSLNGLKVLVTRPRHQAEDFARQLRDLGAEVVIIPMIEINPLPAGPQVLDAIRRLPTTKLVIFTSANGVEMFARLLLAAGQDVRSLQAASICAIGPETARHLEELGVRPQVVADEYTAEGLARALEGWNLAGVRVLVPRARVARDALQSLLSDRGADVQVLAVYETLCPPTAARDLNQLFQAGAPDVITFTSSSTVSNLSLALGPDVTHKLGATKVACIGPVTADTARRLGIRVDIIAREYTTRGLAAAIAEAMAAPGRQSEESSWRSD